MLSEINGRYAYLLIVCVCVSLIRGVWFEAMVTSFQVNNKTKRKTNKTTDSDSRTARLALRASHSPLLSFVCFTNLWAEITSKFKTIVAICVWAIAHIIQIMAASDERRIALGAVAVGFYWYTMLAANRNNYNLTSFLKSPFSFPNWLRVRVWATERNGWN